MSWFKIWNPFSVEGNTVKSEAKDDLDTARSLRDQTAEQKARFKKILEEQQRVAEELRREKRKNHFSELFQQVPPRLPHKED